MMKAITKQDIPKIRTAVAQKAPAEYHLIRLWAEFEDGMSADPSPGSACQALRIIQFVAKKTEVILVDEVALRGHQETMTALSKVSKIRKDCEGLLEHLDG